MYKRLYTNRNSHGDFIENAISKFIMGANTVDIAVAFLTNVCIIEKLKKQGCRVRIVTRLGYPTSPRALTSMLNIPNVEARFFSDTSFHPKLYIFSSSDALVGSANLTNDAMLSNQEIMIHIDYEDEIFSDLTTLFSEYWKDAKVLTQKIVGEYTLIYNKFKLLYSETSNFEQEVYKKIGKVIYQNIQEKTKESKKDRYIEDYRKVYQETVNAFNVIKKVYEDVGKRKEKDIPLRIEIDSFISFVRERYAPNDTWKNTFINDDKSQKDEIKKLIEEWHKTHWPHFDEIVKEKYPLLREVFSSIDTIQKSTEDQLFEALCTIHSFHDRYRFYTGGLRKLKEEFLGKNNFDKIKNNLLYLIFGNCEDDVIKRMANLIYNKELKLKVFGPANVQELIGWCNEEDLPIINGRTTKIMCYLGFNVCQLSDGDK